MSLEINKKLLPVKAHYFLFNAGIGSVLLYMPTLFRQLGFSAAVVGFVYSILPVAAVISRSLFGMIAEKFRIQKFIFIMFLCFTGAALLGPAFVPPIIRETSAELVCGKADRCAVDVIKSWKTPDEIKCKISCKHTPEYGHINCLKWQFEEDCFVVEDEVKFTGFISRNRIYDGTDNLTLSAHRMVFDGRNFSITCSPDFTKLKCRSTCDEPLISVAVSDGIAIEEAAGIYQFWLLFGLLLAIYASMAVIKNLGDIITFQMSDHDQELHGKQKVWATFGLSVFGLLAGILMDQLSKDQYGKDFSVAFYMAVTLVGFDVCTSTQLKYRHVQASKHFFHDIVSIKFIVFLLWCVAVGLASGMLWTFLFWHLEEFAMENGCSRMDWMKTLQGLVIVVQCFGGDLPFFWLSQRLIKGMGHENVMTLVLAAFGLRFWMYSDLTNPWLVLPIECMSGVTVVLFQVTMNSYISMEVHGSEVHLKGLAGGIYEGVGISLGSLIGGILVNNIGTSLTFKYFSIAAFVLAGIHVIIQMILRRV